jgi:hypothetical protein
MTLATWQNMEGPHRAERLREVTADSIEFVRRYDVSSHGLSALPSRGEAVDLDGEAAGSGVTQHRVRGVGWADKKDQVAQVATVRFYQVRLYSGEDNELANSRVAWSDIARRHAVRYYVTTDGATGLPAVASKYVDDSELTLTARMCKGSGPEDLERFPGLHYHVVPYVGVVLADGASYEIARTRRTWAAGNRRYAAVEFITTDGATGLPAIASAYTGDSGAFGRYCQGYDAPDTESIPGLVITRVRYEGVVSAGSGYTGEILGTRQPTATLDSNRMTLQVAATDTTPTIAVGAELTGDSGDTARKCVQFTAAGNAVWGIYVHTYAFDGLQPESE